MDTVTKLMEFLIELMGGVVTVAVLGLTVSAVAYFLTYSVISAFKDSFGHDNDDQNQKGGQ